MSDVFRIFEPSLVWMLQCIYATACDDVDVVPKHLMWMTISRPSCGRRQPEDLLGKWFEHEIMTTLLQISYNFSNIVTLYEDN